MNYLNERKRTQIGFGVSLGFHVLLLFLLSVTGLFSMNLANADDDITEVAYLSGGGGGGGGAPIQQPAPEEQPVQQNAAEPQEQPEAVEEISPDAIIDPSETDKDTPQPQRPRTQVPKENTGSGGGIGTGEGTGNGSGTGTGNGSGNGSGDGDGNGSGVGSGIYDSPAIPPRLISSTAPDYPLSARRARQEGTALVQMLIGVDGEVENASIISSSGYDELDQAALDACSEWSFTAAKNSAGRRVRCYITQPVTFRLR